MQVPSETSNQGTTQSEHRSYISSRSEAIAAVQADVFNGSGKQISSSAATEMFDSIRSFTSDSYYIRSAYNNPNASPQNSEAMKALDEYVKNAPKWEGKIFRGINVDSKTCKDILSRDEIDMLGPASWSSYEDVAQAFARRYNEKCYIVFVLPKNKNGASITHIGTYNGAEGEVISPSGIKYPVKSRKKVHIGGCTYVYIEVSESEDK